MNIISPMPTGNGAYVVHSHLQEQIPGYQLIGYNPLWELMPLAFPLLINTRNANLIHCTPDYAVLFARRNIPLVISFQNYVLDTYMRSYSSIPQSIHYATDLRLFYTLAVSKAKAITAVSEFTAEIAKRDLGITRDIRIIYNGINTKIFRPFKSNKTGKKFRVLFSGNPTKRKGSQWLEGIADHLHDNVEILVTGGLRNGSLHAKNRKIRSIGRVVHQDMPKLYNQVDLLLFPTVREGLSLAVLEAMACGLPVVASSCSSLPEQIKDGKGGYLCTVGNTKKFAEKINELADSPEKRPMMGEFNRTRVEEKFTSEQMVKGYTKLFQEVLDS